MERWLAGRRTATARARLGYTRATADAVIAGTPLRDAPDERDIDPAALVAWLAVASPDSAGARIDAQQRQASMDERWSWASVDAWLHRDPLAPGKALARVTGLPIAAMLDDVRTAIARELDGLVAIAWRRAIADALTDAPAAASSPIVDAILALADAATEYAARRLASEGPAIVGELLGDPRDCPEAWQGSAAAIRAAMGAP